jgi:hypothetical protein
MTSLILFVAAASPYATILGYSRIPFAAARDGDFFSVFSKVHPTKHFPHVSLVVITLISLPFCFFTLGQLVSWLIGADPAALHLAVRGGDRAAARPTGHPAAVHDVAVSSAGVVLWLYIVFTGGARGSPSRSRSSRCRWSRISSSCVGPADLRRGPGVLARGRYS